MQGHDERLRQLLREGQDVLPVPAAEAPTSVPRRSAANVPIPQARGGNVETIAVRI